MNYKKILTKCNYSTINFASWTNRLVVLIYLINSRGESLLNVAMIVRWIFSLILISAALALIFNLCYRCISNYHSLSKLYSFCICCWTCSCQRTITSSCLISPCLYVTWCTSSAWSFCYFVLCYILYYFWTLLIWILLIKIVLICFEHHFFILFFYLLINYFFQFDLIIFVLTLLQVFNR